MSRLLLVSLDLTGPSGSYDELFGAIKAQGTWWHYLKSTWIIDTENTPEEVVDALRPHMAGRGRMLVVPVVRPYQGLLPKAAWEWIRERIE